MRPTRSPPGYEVVTATDAVHPADLDASTPERSQMVIFLAKLAYCGGIVLAGLTITISIMLVGSLLVDPTGTASVSATVQGQHTQPIVLESGAESTGRTGFEPRASVASVLGTLKRSFVGKQSRFPPPPDAASVRTAPPLRHLPPSPPPPLSGEPALHTSSCARGDINSRFVTAHGKQLWRQGKPYRFFGANVWFAANMGAEASGDRARLRRELDRLRDAGVTNVSCDLHGA